MTPARARRPTRPCATLPFALSRARALSATAILMQAGSYDSSTTQGARRRRSSPSTARSPSSGRYTVSVGGSREGRARCRCATRTVVRGPTRASRCSRGRRDAQRARGGGQALDAGRRHRACTASSSSNAPGLEVRDTSITAETASQGRGGRAGMGGSDGSPGQDAAQQRQRAAPAACACSTTNGGGEVVTRACSTRPRHPTAGASGQTRRRERPRRAVRRRRTRRARPRWRRRHRWRRRGVAGDPSGLGVLDARRASWPTRGARRAGHGRHRRRRRRRRVFDDDARGGGGGGGGGGGCGGSPGTGGQGGGGSFGVYLDGRTTVANIIHCTITTRSGGRGGNGGIGDGFMSGDGGAHRLASAAARAAGQAGTGRGAGGAGVPRRWAVAAVAGGLGGVGGAGGPGLGGPSVGIIRVSAARLGLLTATSYTLGEAGPNGAGNIDTPRAAVQPRRLRDRHGRHGHSRRGRNDDRRERPTDAPAR